MKLFYILKYIGAAAGALAVAWGAFAMFDTIRDDVADVKETVDYINVEQAMFAEDYDRHKDEVDDTLNEIKESVAAQDESIRSLGWVVRNQNTFTPEQREILLDEWLSKKKLRPDSVTRIREYEITFEPITD